MKTKIQYIDLLKVMVYLFPEVLLYTNNTINLTYKNFFFFKIFEGLFLYKPFFNVNENPIYNFIKSNGAVIS